tara:strand:- start:1357 stop:1488 length:132 start_codon:yes stop_codon:yes gene_type:complete
MNIEKIAKEIFFHAQAYKQDVIDKDDFTQAIEDILTGEHKFHQ